MRSSGRVRGVRRCAAGLEPPCWRPCWTRAGIRNPTSGRRPGWPGSWNQHPLSRKRESELCTSSARRAVGVPNTPRRGGAGTAIDHDRRTSPAAPRHARPAASILLRSAPRLHLLPCTRCCTRHAGAPGSCKPLSLSGSRGADSTPAERTANTQSWAGEGSFGGGGCDTRKKIKQSNVLEKKNCLFFSKHIRAKNARKNIATKIN